jgi:hypothetical protein
MLTINTLGRHDDVEANAAGMLGRIIGSYNSVTRCNQK